MFDWFFALFKKKSDFRHDLYKPKDRGIYHYWNGIELIKADPLILYKRVMDKAPDLSIDYKVSKSIHKDAKKAHTALILNLREIFSVKDFNEGGLSELEVFDLMDHFLAYCEWLKKNSRMLPSQPTAISPTSSSSTGESPTTKNSSDTGSTETIFNTEKPDPSLSEPASV